MDSLSIPKGTKSSFNFLPSEFGQCWLHASIFFLKALVHCSLALAFNLASPLLTKTADAHSVNELVAAKNSVQTPTGVLVRRGEHLLIEAKGEWCMGGVPPTAECGSPQGIRRASPVEFPLILDSAKIGALIGRIGNGPWLKVGEQVRVTARRDGELFLLFNDRPCCYIDNSGTVTATIRKITKVRSLAVQAISQNGTPTNLLVQRGEQLFVEARGEWCMGGVPPTAECGSPQGIRRASPVEFPLIVNGAKIGALVGRIGNGPWFKLGEQAGVTARRDGELFLLFNDRPCCYGDNSGHVRVNVYKVNR